MKFSEYMLLMIILKVTKKQGFNLSLENTLLEKPQEWVKLNPLPSPSLFTVKLYSYKNVCSRPCSKPAETYSLCCLQRSPEVLLKADFVTDFVFMFQATYKYTRLTLIETVLLSFFVQAWNTFLFAEVLSKATTQTNSEK